MEHIDIFHTTRHILGDGPPVMAAFDLLRHYPWCICTRSICKKNSRYGPPVMAVFELLRHYPCFFENTLDAGFKHSRNVYRHRFSSLIVDSYLFQSIPAFKLIPIHFNFFRVGPHKFMLVHLLFWTFHLMVCS